MYRVIRGFDDDVEDRSAELEGEECDEVYVVICRAPDHQQCNACPLLHMRQTRVGKMLKG